MISTERDYASWREASQVVLLNYKDELGFLLQLRDANNG
tara:strand:+ start:18840 stop:18956 length:117 start_codon:yes stop_codon:yes gene_type:complete